VVEPSARRLFWDRVFDGRVAELALAGDEIAARRELIRLLDSARSTAAPTQGVVHFVGAGPGDPDLLTLKAHRLLQRADIIVYDRLVAPDVLAMARRDAERLAVSPAEAVQRLVTFARAGRSVVRLGTGDFFDEIEALGQAGVSLEVVPGVSTFAPPASSLKSSR
jgi:uroporphyrin-III C-methyltransferase/precorrin-2 dehydrogenase/sirohydrochlorin ferrochelatase